MNKNFNPDRLEKMAKEYLEATRSIHDTHLKVTEQMIGSINALHRENFRLIAENERLKTLMSSVN